MDDGLWLGSMFLDQNVTLVLILALMDDGLWFGSMFLDAGVTLS